MANLNPAQMQAEFSKTEAQVRAELNALKGLRFGAEKAAWRDRVDRKWRRRGWRLLPRWCAKRRSRHRSRP